MRKVGSRARCGARLQLSFSLLVLALGVPLTQAAESAYAITFSGQSIVSIFDGLIPSPFALEYRLERQKPKGVRGLLEKRDLGGIFGGDLLRVQCQQCPSDTVCADHYQKLVPSSGCIDPLGACPLPLNNTETDTQSTPYSQGSYDSYCGKYCCVDENDCDNP